MIRKPATSRNDKFLSTLSLRRATDSAASQPRNNQISIHALLAESDPIRHRIHRQSPTISIHALLAESDNLRVVDGSKSSIISIHALLAESDCQWRRSVKLFRQFLSTLSLRRATITQRSASSLPSFLSTLSLRRATCVIELIECGLVFLSTLSLRRATVFGFTWLAACAYFYPRSPCGERQ